MNYQKYIDKVERLRSLHFSGEYIKNVSIKAIKSVAARLGRHYDDLYFFNAGEKGYACFIKK